MTGLVHIYHGTGKGKTTAALGLAIRALGRNKKILFVQFMKAWDSGELHILDKLDGINVMRGKPSAKFSFQMTESEKKACSIANNELLAEVESIIKTDKADLLILDELIGTYHNELIDREQVVRFIKNKPDKLELVMTGRNPEPELLELANYVSEIVKRKHPFDEGLKARIGIEH